MADFERAWEAGATLGELLACKPKDFRMFEAASKACGIEPGVFNAAAAYHEACAAEARKTRSNLSK